MIRAFCQSEECDRSSALSKNANRFRPKATWQKSCTGDASEVGYITAGEKPIAWPDAEQFGTVEISVETSLLS